MGDVGDLIDEIFALRPESNFSLYYMPAGVGQRGPYAASWQAYVMTPVYFKKGQYGADKVSAFGETAELCLQALRFKLKG